MMKYLVAALAAVFLTAGSAGAGEIKSSVDASTLAKKKQTPLGLYLTPKDAWQAVLDNPSILFLDVRDPIEINFVGHAVPTDAIVPLAFATLDFDVKGGKYKMKANENFVADFERVAAREGIAKDDPIFVICRSGARSAVAVRKLAEAGYTNVWNIVEGFEGDKDKETGQRTVNGWKNAGLPWSYKIDAAVAYLPAQTN